MKDLDYYSEKKESFCLCITLIIFLVSFIDCKDLHAGQQESAWTETLGRSFASEWPRKRLHCYTMEFKLQKTLG